MSNQTMKKREIRTQALVLRRTNYGEADRILNLLTPEGKKSVLAKAVRKEKSKLAGGVEMFCLSEVVLHQGKGELYTLTSAKMLEFYQKIISDLKRIELASDILKKVSKASDLVEAEDFFLITKQSLNAINRAGNLELIEAWFLLNLAKTSGEQINFLVDINGEKLKSDLIYAWDTTDNAFYVEKKGSYAVNEIKMLRLMLIAKLDLVLRVSEAGDMAAKLLYVARAISQV